MQTDTPTEEINENQNETQLLLNKEISKNTKKFKISKIISTFRTSFLTILLLVCILIFALFPFKSNAVKIAIQQNYNSSISLNTNYCFLVRIDLNIPTFEEIFGEKNIKGDVYLNISFIQNDPNPSFFRNESIYLNPNMTREMEQRIIFYCSEQIGDYKILFSTNSIYPIPFMANVSYHSRLYDFQLYIALVILVISYTLIIVEYIPRPLASIYGAFMCIAVLSIFKQKPNLEEVISFVEWDTLLLIASMMMLFGLLKKTGFFEWIGLQAYKLSGGSVWKLTVMLNMLCYFISLLIDTEPILIFMTPLVMELSQILNTSPIPLMISIGVMGNIGGASTSTCGELVVILTNEAMQRHGITFLKMFLYLFPGGFMSALATLIPIRIVYRKFYGNEIKVPNIERINLEKSIQIWKKTLKKISGHGEAEKSVRKKLKSHISELKQELKKLKKTKLDSIEKLSQVYKIKNYTLLIKTIIIIIIVMIFFFIESLLKDYIHLNITWIAIMGGIFVEIFVGTTTVEEVFEDVEWATLTFFASLFILINGLEKMGLISFVGGIISQIVISVPESYRLFAAITLILWISGIISSVIDNVSYITAMVPILLTLAEPPLSLPMTPLVNALIYGVILGGNGTLVGCASNVLFADLCRRRGHYISFWEYLKLGVPVTFLTLLITYMYLIIIHVVFGIGV